VGDKWGVKGEQKKGKCWNPTGAGTRENGGAMKRPDRKKAYEGGAEEDGERMGGGGTELQSEKVQTQNWMFSRNAHG